MTNLDLVKCPWTWHTLPRIRNKIRLLRITRVTLCTYQDCRETLRIFQPRTSKVLDRIWVTASAVAPEHGLELNYPSVRAAVSWVEEETRAGCLRGGEGREEDGQESAGAGDVGFGEKEHSYDCGGVDVLYLCEALSVDFRGQLFDDSLCSKESIVEILFLLIHCSLGSWNDTPQAVALKSAEDTS